jgi:hypothetical protein
VSGEFQWLVEAIKRGTIEERRQTLTALGGVLLAQAEIMRATEPSESVPRNCMMPPELAEWLGAALAKLGEGEDLKTAFSMNVSANKTTSFFQTSDAERRVQALRDAGATQEEAIAKVADQLGIDQDTLAQRLRRM